MTKDTGGPFDGDSAQRSLEMVYDRTTEIYHAQHDWTSNDSFTVTIVKALAVVTGTEPVEMEPLHSVVDPDALDAALSSGKEAGVRVEFEYAEQSVTVTGSGEVLIQEVV